MRTRGLELFASVAVNTVLIVIFAAYGLTTLAINSMPQTTNKIITVSDTVDFDIYFEYEDSPVASILLQEGFSEASCNISNGCLSTEVMICELIAVSTDTVCNDFTQEN